MDGNLVAQADDERNEPDFEPPRFRESVAFDTDPTVVKRLASVQDYVAAEKWGQAIDVVTRVAEEHGETLIAVGPRRYVDVATYCQMLLAAFPEAGRAAYRSRVDPQARAWFEAGRTSRDESLLRKVVRQAFVSTYGDDALLLLGQWAWERGELGPARGFWTQMLPLAEEVAPGKPLPVLRYPDTDHGRAEILARPVLCSLAGGDFSRAGRERAAFKRMYPGAHGKLAGREGNLAEILGDVAEEAREWTFPDQDGSATMFALNARRNKILPQAVDVGAIDWAAPLPLNRLELPTPRPALRDGGPLSYFPVVWEGLVFVVGPDRIFAWDLQTGRPAWSFDAIYMTDVDRELPLPNQPVAGVPFYTATIDHGRLYVRMGWPIAARAKDELRAAPGRLVCLDLRKEGKLDWSIVPDEQDPGWAFEGSPVVADGRVYIALRRRRPEMQTNVACYDAATGRPLWNRRVCAAVGAIGEDRNLLGHNLLTLAGGTIFYNTNLGAVAALEAETGRLRWFVTYESRRGDDAAELSDPAKQGLTPCLYERGTVVAAPADSDRIMGLDAETGVLKWERGLNDRVRQLLGAAHGNVIVSGNHLWAIDVETGRIVWRSPLTDDPAEFGYGRGVLAGDVVFWPKREEILKLDQRTGRLVGRIDLKRLHGTGGGNLLIADGHLIVAEPDRLVVYGQHAGRRYDNGKTARAARYRWKR